MLVTLEGNLRCLVNCRYRLSSFCVRKFVKHNYFSTLLYHEENDRGKLSERPEYFYPKKAVVLSKISRYEFEKTLCPDVSEETLRDYLLSRNSDYYRLLERHKYHQQCVQFIEESLSKKNIETKVVSRFDLTPDLIKWTDVIVSAGGDGTFLLAASKVHDQTKPVIGVNTDPQGSVGHLLLPKGKFAALQFNKALDKLLNLEFLWKWRQRIRITMTGRHANDEAVELHDEQFDSQEDRFNEHKWERELYERRHAIIAEKCPRVLPVLALNEVFLGERLSSRVSYYEMTVDGEQYIKQKSSGLTIATGTGSTSWLFNINHLSTKAVEDILRIAKEKYRINLDHTDTSVTSSIAKTFNESLVFDPSYIKMAYAVRDPVRSAISSVPFSRGFASSMKVHSRMWDACLVVDGGSSFKFNDGTVAILEIYPEDALRTISICDD